MKTKIDIKNWETGEVIFSYECEDNTIRKTVEEAVIQGISLAYANLSYANLTHGYLRNIDLSCADLRFADLRFADLRFANLSGANLNNAILLHTNFLYTNLSYANLSDTDIYYIYNFSFADLNGINLTNTNLTRVNLDNADLSTAILDNVKGLNDKCPKEGSFIGWKICYINHRYPYKCCPYIVKLEILADAKRSSATTNKCRCSKAKVLKIENLDGTIADVDTVYSRYDKNFAYKIGEIVEVSNFNEHYWKECASGIHFFMNKEDALNFIP